MYKRKFDLIAKAFAFYGVIDITKSLEASFRMEHGKYIFTFLVDGEIKEVIEK